MFLSWCGLALATFLNAGTPDTLTTQEMLQRFLADPAEATRETLYRRLYAEDDLGAWINACKEAGKQARDGKSLPEEGLAQMHRATEDQLWRPPCTDGEWQTLGWLYSNIAFTYNGYFADFNRASQYYEKALAIFDDRLGEAAPMVARYVLLPLGNLKTKLGDEQSAEMYLQKAKSICIAHRDNSMAAAAYSDLGILYQSMGRFDRAIAILEEGLALTGLPTFRRGLLEGNLASVYNLLGQPERALDYARSSRRSFARDTLRTDSDSPRIKLAGVDRMIGEIYTQTGQWPQARRHFQQAETLLLRIVPSGKLRLLSKLYTAWGQLALRAGDCRGAIDYYNRALGALLDDFDPAHYRDNPETRQLFPDIAIGEALAGKADALTAHFEKNGATADLQAALDCHDLIFAVEKRLRRSYHYDSSKLFNLEESRARSEKGIALALQLAEHTGEDHYRRQAFTFAERSKSILLLEAFVRDNAALAADIPQHLRDEERALQAEIARKEKALFDAQASGHAELNPLREELFALRKKYTEFIFRLEAKYEAYYNLRYKFDPVSPEQVGAFLAPDQTLIEYFTGSEQIFVFVIQQDLFEIIALPRNFPLNEWVVQLRSDIEQFQFPGVDRQVLCQQYSERAYRLYEKLVAPLAELPLTERLLIIPSGVLGYLPFDALLIRPANTCRFRDYPYLIREHTIAYGYSATLQAELTTRQYATTGFLGVAPRFDGQGGFGQLRDNRESLKRVRRQHGGKVLLGPAARSEAFLDLAGRYQVLQLATHAQANTESGDFSFIVFQGSDGQYDSLFVKDIYLLDLAAELVVLSACETAVGSVFESEGIISLARAFLYAGARSLVTSFWSINEGANLPVVERFYTYWEAGSPKDVALKKAKLKQLSESDRLLAHPVYWAALSAIGVTEGEPAFTGRHWKGWLSAGAGVLFFFFLLLYRKKIAGRLTRSYRDPALT